LEKIKEVNFENTEEAQALENALRILVRMIVRTIMSETSIQRKIISKVDVEPATLSPKINPEQQEESLLLNVRDGARLLKVSRSRVYELVHSRQIPSVRLGKRILIPRAKLTRFIEEVANDSMNTERQF
jgi:excisionase family DNA binding protein